MTSRNPPAPFFVSNPTSTVTQATIDDDTSRIVLPVIPFLAAYLKLEGSWGDEDYGPGASAVTLKVLSQGRKGEYRLSRNSAFMLPAGTELVELEVVTRVPGMDLVLSIIQAAPKFPPSPPPLPAHIAAREIVTAMARRARSNRPSHPIPTNPADLAKAAARHRSRRGRSFAPAPGVRRSTQYAAHTAPPVRSAAAR